MLRLILIFTVIFLIVRAFVITGLESRNDNPAPQKKEPAGRTKKGVPRELGEYVEYEEVERKG
jgi:hypothetical protein